MNRRGPPVAWVLTGAVFGTVLVVFAIGLGFLARSTVLAYRSQLVEKTATIGQVVADYCASDLAFGDRREATLSLALLRRNEEVDSAILFDERGFLFAYFVRDGLNVDVPSRLTRLVREPETRVVPEAVEVSIPVQRDGVRYGTMVLRASTGPLDARIESYATSVGTVAASLALAALLFAVVIQRVIAAPFTRIAEAATRIRETADYAVRMPRGGGREIDAVSDAFNQMLSAIELRQRQWEVAEDIQSRYAERLRILRHIEAGIVEGQMTQVVVARALEGLGRLLEGAWSAVVEVSSEGTGTMVGRARDGVVESDAVFDGAVDTLVRIATRVGAPRGLVELPVDTLPEWKLVAPMVGVAGMTHLAIAPLHWRDEVLGLLFVGRAVPVSLNQEQVQVVEGIAEILAVCIHEARLTVAVADHTLELERRVEIRTAQLAATNRELEGFAYSIAHDLRAPLRQMQGFSAILLEDQAAQMDESGREYLLRIARASERMDRLIRDLLEYSRLSVDSLVMEPVVLSGVVTEAIEVAKGWAGWREVGLTVECGDEPVWGHRPSMVQMVANLLSNAVKFIDRGVEPRVRVRSEPRGDRVRLWVEDNGIGIDPDFHGRIFRVFERLHATEQYPGTGIGLAIVKKAAERLGGTVGVDSEPGKGSRFWVEFVSAVG